jgi:hypothetical protein
MATVNALLAMIENDAGKPIARRQAAEAAVPFLPGLLSSLLDPPQCPADELSPAEILRLLLRVAENAVVGLRLNLVAFVLLTLVQVSAGSLGKNHTVAIIKAINAWLTVLTATDARASSLFVLDIDDLLRDCRSLWIALLESVCSGTFIHS